MTRPHSFKHADVRRAFRAASDAGVKNPRIEVHLPSGGHFVIGSGGSVPEAPPKKSRQLRADLAEGGDVKMHGRGDRTRTAPEDSAGEQRPGSTAHKTSDRGSKLAEGGSPHGVFKRQAADPANPGRTAKTQSAASPKQASGGLSPQAEESRAVGGMARPALPGRTGC
jgi:hypothetical protein